MPLLLLKLMDQSRHGVTRILEAQTHPMAVAIPGAFAPPAFASPQTLIDPSALRAAKAYSLE
jgi:hypothetical protein